MHNFLYILFCGFLLSGCKEFEDKYCESLEQQYPITYKTKDKSFNGCLLAENSGEMILVTSDSLQVKLHAVNGNFSDPLLLERDGDVYKYLFRPIHNRKTYQLTGRRGWPGPVYELLFEDKTINFYVTDEKLLEFDVPVILKPDWQKAQPNQVKENSSLELTNFEMASAGVNVIVHSYLYADSLFLNLKVINHSDRTIYLFQPEQLVENKIKLASDELEIRRGNRFSGKYAFPAKAENEYLIEKRLIYFKINDKLISVLNQDLRLIKDQTEQI